MSVEEIKSEIESLPMEDRRQLAAYLIALRHKDLTEYRTVMAGKIDDQNPENWLSLEEYDTRIAS
jgi:hypothetical protein